MLSSCFMVIGEAPMLCGHDFSSIQQVHCFVKICSPQWCPNAVPLVGGDGDDDGDEDDDDDAIVGRWWWWA